MTDRMSATVALAAHAGATSLFSMSGDPNNFFAPGQFPSSQ